MQRAEDRPHPFCGRKAKRRGTGGWSPDVRPHPAKTNRVMTAMLQMKKIDIAGLERAAAG